MEIVVGGAGGGKLYSQNLRDFLGIKEEDNQRHLDQSSSSSSGGGSRRSSSSLTISAILGEKIGHGAPADEPPLQRIQSNRTLLDIIREDQTSGIGRGRGSWNHLRDKIRLRRRGGGAAWSSTVPNHPSSAVTLNDNDNRVMTMATRHLSTRFNSNIHSGEPTQPNVMCPSSHRNPGLAERASGRFEQTTSLPRRQSISGEGNLRENDEEEQSGDTAEGAVEGEGSSEPAVRTSLMALLAENDRQMGYGISAYVMNEDEEVETVAGGAINGVGYNSCCICMVRHKGAAFIPCGHTFCRLCSRELWVQRGNCPLCNNHILEILDIF